MRAAIYTRVSSAELQADGYSLQAQEAVCSRLTKERGWQVIGVFTDPGVSARTTERPGFQAMMQAARAGRFDVLVVHKLDRFSRSVVDQLRCFGELSEANVAFVSASEGKFDFSSPAGKLQMTVLGAVNEWYLDNLSAEVSKGLKARAEAGMWLGEVPFGYDCHYKKDGGDGVAYPNEEEAEGVRLAFETYATGVHSYRDVAEVLNEAGYRPRGRGDRALALWSKDSVNLMLTNRFYVGEVEYHDEHFPGLHEPIISDELFERVQQVRRRRASERGKAPRKSRVYPLTGVARCARCGWPMRGSSASGYRYYRDPAADQGRDCDQLQVRAQDAEDALGDLLRELTLPGTWQEEVLALVEGNCTKPKNGPTKAQIEGRLERLKRLYILGDLSEREYRTERDQLRAKLAELTPPELPDLQRAAALLQDFGAIWDAATPKERKQIVRTLLEAVYLDAGDDGPVTGIEPKAEYKALFQLM
jgi:site-specific DNA recombinase